MQHGFWTAAGEGVFAGIPCCSQPERGRASGKIYKKEENIKIIKKI